MCDRILKTRSSNFLPKCSLLNYFGRYLSNTVCVRSVDSNVYATLPLPRGRPPSVARNYHFRGTGFDSGSAIISRLTLQPLPSFFFKKRCHIL